MAVIGRKIKNMKRSTVIFQQINNHNAGDIILHLHRLWCRNPKHCAALLKRLPFEKVKPIERWVSQCFWWVHRAWEFETFLREIVFDKFIPDTNIDNKRNKQP